MCQSTAFNSLPVACRVRVQARLQRLKLFLDRLGRDFANVQQEIDEPSILSGAASSKPGAAAQLAGPRACGSSVDSQSPPADQAVADRAARCTWWPHKQCHEADFLLEGEQSALPSQLPDQQAFEPFEQQVPMAYKLSGYAEEPHWGFDGNLALPFEPPEEVTFDDDVTPATPWHLPDGCTTELTPAQLDMTDKLAAAAREVTGTVPIGSRWAPTQEGMCAPRPRLWGRTLQHPIRPAKLQHDSMLEREAPASNSVRALQGRPLLSEAWRQPRIHSQAAFAQLQRQLGAALPRRDDLFPTQLDEQVRTQSSRT